MNPVILVVPPLLPEVNTATGYIIGTILATFIQEYLLCSFVIHDKS